MKSFLELVMPLNVSVKSLWMSILVYSFTMIYSFLHMSNFAVVFTKLESSY